MNILAINFNHDGAAVLLRDGAIAGYVNTERFSRRKKHPGVRTCDIENLLEQAGLRIGEVDLVQLLNLNNMGSPDVVKLHGSTLKETWPDFWIDGTYRKVRLLDEILPCTIVPDSLHHHAHAALAYSFSPFESGVSFACDPVGATAFFVRGSQPLHVQPISMTAPAVYTRVSEHMFGTGILGAGKLMGLAPYGAEAVRIPMDYQRLKSLTQMDAFDALVRATAESPIEIGESGQSLNASLAWHAQAFLEFELSHVLEGLYLTCINDGLEPNLCLSGGTALNSVANQRCFQRSQFLNLYLHPACGDDGTAIGSTLMLWHFAMQQPRKSRSNREAMYSCRTYDEGVPAILDRYQDSVLVARPSDITGVAAQLIADGKVIGWFQGASEIGPRALGNRSILADPRSATMRDHLNLHVKRREGFRPFAPSILAEHSHRWFGDLNSPFMLRVARVRRNEVPAVTHVDGTARFQTVERQDNPRYHSLIARFHELTDVPMVLNTSFNGCGEPIVETPEDALNCMLSSKLDAVIFRDHIATPRPSK